MPRTARASEGGLIYHALNRGNRRAEVFHKPKDYDAFLEAIIEARRHLAVDLFGDCLMPNHFHLVLRPHKDGDLGRWMRRLLTTHAKRYHLHYGTSGHVWQGRYKAFPVQDDGHLFAVLRYVERNPLRAELVARAEDWQWSSLKGRLAGAPDLWLTEPSPPALGWLEESTNRSRPATSPVCKFPSPGSGPSGPTTGRGRRRSGWAWGSRSEADPGSRILSPSRMALS